MGAAWVDGDNQSEKRRNREWILGRLRAPAYDTDDVGTVTVNALAVDGLDMQTSFARHYLVPPTVTVTMVHSLTLLNRSSVTQPTEVLIGVSDGSGSYATRENLSPGDTLALDGPWFLKPTDTIWTRAPSAANVVSLRSEVTEFTGAMPGVTLAVVDGIILPTVHTGLYICPLGGVRHATIAAVTLCNFTASTVLVGIGLTPTGAAWNLGQHYLFLGPIYAFETVILDGFVMKPGDVLAGSASLGSSIACRISPIEFAV